MPVAIKRYIEETSRLYSVLEDGLAANGDWLVGDKFSIADINAFTWTSSNGTSGIDMTPFPRVLQWIDRIAAREGVINGLKVPTVRKLPDAAAAKENVAKGKEWIAEGDKILAEAK
jgi:glutathione S-transferase